MLAFHRFFIPHLSDNWVSAQTIVHREAMTIVNGLQYHRPATQAVAWCVVGDCRDEFDSVHL